MIELNAYSSNSIQLDKWITQQKNFCYLGLKKNS